MQIIYLTDTIKDKVEAIFKVKEMEADALRELLSGRDLTFKCMFLGSEDVNMGAADLRAECARVLKKCAANARSTIFLFKWVVTAVKVRINLKNIRIDGEIIPGISLFQFEHPIKGILLIAGDADDKRVFGYVCSQPYPTGYGFYAFKSTQGPAENIINILNKALEVANNSRNEAGSSKECQDNFTQEANVVKKDQPQTEEKGQERNVHRMLRKLDQQVTHLQTELREKELGETNLYKPQWKEERREENLRKQSHEMEQQLTNLHGQLQERNEQLRDVNRQMTVVQGKLREKDEEIANLQNQATALRQQLEEKDQEMEPQLTDLRRQLKERNEHLRDVTQQVTVVRGRLQEKDEETANLQNQLDEKDKEITELETTLSTAQDELRDYQRQQSPEWVISRDHIQLTDKLLGRGGWGSVVEGKYCGCSVAVKQIHELILSPHNRKLFEREMDIASKCRHPCLLQFIGATNDEGNPLFVTELMETSLRTLLEQRALSEVEVSLISLDVARALSYLHQKQPSPIIHRDISSANVLLWRQGEHWRSKVSDYGTANFLQQTMTVAPGSMIYSAPEAFTKNQTVKVDVFSFAVLFCEMCIRELPDPERRVRQVAMVKDKLNRALIRRCLESEPEARPSIQEIIDELKEPN